MRKAAWLLGVAAIVATPAVAEAASSEATCSVSAALVGMLGVDNPACHAGSEGVQVRFDGLAANRSLALRDVTSTHWPADFRQGDSGPVLAWLYASASAQRGWWGVETFVREDAWFHGDANSLQLYYDSQSGNFASVRGTQAFAYQLATFQAQGVKLRAVGSWASASGEQLALGADVELLRGSSLHLDTAAGTVSGTSAAAVLDGSRTLVNTGLPALNSSSSFNDFVPSSAQDVGAGTGWGIDLGMHWRSSGGLRLSLAANDLLANLRWPNAPLVQQTVSQLQVPVTEVFGHTSISGLDAYQSVRVHLAPRYAAQAAYGWRGWTWFGSYEQTHGYGFPGLGIAREWSGHWLAVASLDLRYHSSELLLQHDGWRLGLRSDVLSPRSAKVFGWVLEWSHSL